MMDARNLGVLTCGIVADLETAADGKILKLRLGADWAGTNSEDREDRKGYFDGIYWLNVDNANVAFVKKQMAEGNMKKGSSIVIAYRLSQSRYLTKDGVKSSRVELVIDSINWAGQGQRPVDAETTPAAGEQLVRGGSPAATAAPSVPLPNQF